MGTLDRLPFQLHARAEWGEVGRKPLGDGFVAQPAREFRGAVTRQFGERIQAGAQFLIARGYTGQTTGMFTLPGENGPREHIAGVRLPSSVSLSFHYRFGHR